MIVHGHLVEASATARVFDNSEWLELVLEYLVCMFCPATKVAKTIPENCFWPFVSTNRLFSHMKHILNSHNNHKASA